VTLHPGDHGCIASADGGRDALSAVQRALLPAEGQG
jgi:hypothetical protein